MRRHWVAVQSIRLVDHDIARGVYPDMTRHGWETDEWPEILEQAMAAHGNQRAAWDAGERFDFQPARTADGA